MRFLNNNNQTRTNLDRSVRSLVGTTATQQLKINRLDIRFIMLHCNAAMHWPTVLGVQLSHLSIHPKNEIDRREHKTQFTCSHTDRQPHKAIRFPKDVPSQSPPILARSFARSLAYSLLTRIHIRQEKYVVLV